MLIQEELKSDKTEDLPLFYILEHLMGTLGIPNITIIDTLSLINKREYNRIRKAINIIFDVDSIEPYKGKVGEDTEYGDITDVFQIFILERFPNIEDIKDTFLTYNQRKEWRDTLIKELDEMIAR